MVRQAFPFLILTEIYILHLFLSRNTENGNAFIYMCLHRRVHCLRVIDVCIVFVCIDVSTCALFDVCPVFV
jgi:hypothetical protein